MRSSALIDVVGKKWMSVLGKFYINSNAGVDWLQLFGLNGKIYFVFLFFWMTLGLTETFSF